MGYQMLSVTVCLAILCIIECVSSLRCYTCRHISTDGNKEIGSSEGCREHFVMDTQIGTIHTCNGNCSIQYESSSNRVSYHRGCEQDCREERTEATWTKCCQTDYCNTAVSWGTNHGTIAVLLGLGLAAMRLTGI